jgi:hypothetical protein
MENTNVGVSPAQEGKTRSGLLRFSLGANAVLAIAAVALAVWGWGRHQQVKVWEQQVIELDTKVAAANEERDEAYQISRDLQYGLIKAKGELKGVNETLRPQTAADSEEADSQR